MFAVSKIRLAAAAVLVATVALTGCSNPFTATKPTTAKERGTAPLPQEPGTSVPVDTQYPVILPGKPVIDQTGLAVMKKEVAGRTDKCDGDQPAGVQATVPTGYVRVVSVNTTYKNAGRYDTYCITQDELAARRAKRAEWIKVYEGEFDKYLQGHPGQSATQVAVNFLYEEAGMEFGDAYYRYVVGKRHYDDAMSQQTSTDDKRPLSYWKAVGKADVVGIVQSQVILCRDSSVDVYEVP